MVAINQHCCAHCFSDNAIKSHIESVNKNVSCDFCGSEGAPGIEIDEIAKFIDEGIMQKYEDAAKQVPYESAEGGYQMGTLCVADILLHEEQVFDEDNLESPVSLADRLDHASQLHTVPRVRQHPYGDGPWKHMSAWKQFCERIKHTSRFTMFHSYIDHARAKLNGDTPEGDPDGEMYLLNEFFYDFDQFMPEHTKEIPADTQIYRARLAKPGETFKHKEITSPPLTRTRNNRMSPQGISYFYGAFEKETAVSEVRPHLGARVGVGEFRSASTIHILDLTDLPEAKSIFDLDYYCFERDEFFIPFMAEFAQEVSKPIAPQDEVLEYIPTQAFCEFLQVSLFQHSIQGVKYKSALRNNGTCLVIFRGPDISLEEDSSTEPKAVSGNRGPWLKYLGIHYV